MPVLGHIIGESNGQGQSSCLFRHAHKPGARQEVLFRYFGASLISVHVFLRFSPYRSEHLITIIVKANYRRDFPAWVQSVPVV